MSDQQMLLLVLLAIYLSECFVWVGQGAVAMRAAWRRFKVVDPPIFPGNDRGGWALANPLPPFGTVFVCHQWPVVLTAEQVGPQTGQSVNFRQRPPTDAVVIPWAAAGKLESSGHRLSLGGEPMMHLPDEAAAETFNTTLATLAAMPPDRRAEGITRALRHSFDTAAVERRLTEYRRETWLLSLLGILFFCLLFVLLPLSIYLERFTDTVYRLLPATLLIWLAIGVLYVRAHRRLLRARHLDRWKGLATLVFTPTAAVRAAERISRHLLAGFDPVAVGAVVLPEGEFRRLATRVLRDLSHPLPPPDTEREAAASTAVAEFRQKLIGEVVRVAESKGVTVASMDTDPQPSDSAHRAYCPRCRLEYLIEQGTCRDCGEHPLEPFAAVTP